jgi:hypothetical protein
MLLLCLQLGETTLDIIERVRELFFGDAVALGERITELARTAVHLVEETTPTGGLIYEVRANEAKGNPDHEP